MSETIQRPASRPLSEISENEDRRRVSARISSYSSTLSLKGGELVSRPASETRDDAKRLSVPVHTITLNLADYSPSPASKSSTAFTAPPTVCTSPVSAAGTTTTGKRKSIVDDAPPPPLVAATASTSSAPSDETLETLRSGADEESVIDLSEASEGISPLLASMRANLRPTGQQLNGATNAADQDKASPSTSSSSSPRSSVDLGRPTPRVKPNWLKRASMAPVLRTKSRSPAQSPIDLAPEPSSPRMSTHYTGSTNNGATPPALPPRKFPTGPLDTAYEGQAPPPQHPGRRESISHHIPSMSGKSRWGWGSGQGSTNGVSRSSSTNSILSTASAAHQRLPASAQRVLGTASHAVSRTWMRARGVGSNMSISTAAGSPHGHYESAIASSPRSPGLLMRQLSRDSDFAPASEPPSWTEGVVRRNARTGLKPGRVFGRELEIAGRLYGVVEADAERAGDSEYERRRRLCLPAIVVRCVEYLEQWGPKEEGIFRISGRSSHLARLRKEFDAGADLDLSMSEPSDLDPHAVSGIFKTYIRELPSPMLSKHVEDLLDDYLLKSRNEQDVDRIAEVLKDLPPAHWFLLADVIMLIDLIPKHMDVNRMSHNALMISLGPTLQLRGEHIDLLLQHRELVFAEPPEVAPRDLVDFGDEEQLQLTPQFDDAPLPVMEPLAPPAPSLAKRPAPRVSKKPSFSNLLGAARFGSSSSVRRSQSDLGVSLSSSSGSRNSLLVPRTSTTNLKISAPVAVLASSPATSESGLSAMSAVSSLPKSPMVKASDTLEETLPAPGTVKARSRVYSTPIADRFKRTDPYEDLLAPKDASDSGTTGVSSSASSIASSFGELVPPVNPMSGLKRSPPIFFQSAIGSSTKSGPRNVTAGKKRKDEDGAERSNKDGAPGGAKRLSSGPSLYDD